MKKLFSAIMLIAMAAMVACTPEDDPNNGGGTNTDSENMVDVGELTTEVNSDLWFDDYGTACFAATWDQPLLHFSCRVEWNSLGKTIDLSKPQTGVEYGMRYEACIESEEDMIMFTQRNYGDGGMYSDLNFDEGTSSPIFTSGTLTTTHTDEGYTLLVEGVLTDGTDVLIKLKVAYTDEVVILTENSVIYDGVKYDLSTNVTASNGLVHWTSTGSNGVSASGSMLEYYNGIGIFLQEYPIPGGDYYCDFAVDVPGLQLSYVWDHVAGLSCTLNGETVSNAFTDGEASIYAYNDQMSFNVKGTLTNGKEIKIWTRGNYIP